MSGRPLRDGEEQQVADVPGLRAYCHLCIIRGSGHRGSKERGLAGCHHTRLEAIARTDEGARGDKPCGAIAVFCPIHGATEKERLDSELSSRRLPDAPALTSNTLEREKAPPARGHLGRLREAFPQLRGHLGSAHRGPGPEGQGWAPRVISNEFRHPLLGVVGVCETPP